MKKKILTIIFAFVLCLSTFCLTACVGGGGGGSMDDEIDKVLPKPEEPSKGEDDKNSANFEDFFYGYTVLTNGGSTYQITDEVTGNKVEFNTLLDRQISTLAEDILYRLYIMYGDSTYGANNDYKSLQLQNGEFKLQNNDYATVVRENLLTHLTDHDDNKAHDILSDSEVYPNIDCIYCYKNVINTADGDLNNPKTIKFSNAIMGQYTLLSSRNELLNSLNPDKQWKVTNILEDKTTTNLNTLNNFKMAIAKMLVGENYIDAVWADNDYTNALSRINNLGFYADKQALILNYVNKSIIGENLITENLNIYNTFTDENKYNFTTWDSTDTEKHLYKGYNITIPAIVEMALSNKFATKNADNSYTFTETSIYPYFLRVNDVDGTFEVIDTGNNNGDLSFGKDMTTTKPINFNTLILKPKEGVLPNELMLTLNVARDTDAGKAPTSIKTDTTRYKRDIVVELQVNITYVTNGETLFSKAIKAWKEDDLTLTIDGAGYVSTAPDPTDPSKPLPPSGEFLPYTFSFDLEGAAKDDGKTIKSLHDYNGSKKPIADMSLWNNDFKVADDKNSMSLKVGTNYIQVSFNIISIKQKTGGKEGDLVNYLGTDVVYDLNIMPVTF